MGINPYFALFHDEQCLSFLRKIGITQLLSRPFPDIVKRMEKMCELRQVLEADLRHFITHEQHHYAAYVGRGPNIGWGSGSNGHVGSFGPFQEVLAELFAQQITRLHGYAPTEVGFVYGAAVGFYLQHIVADSCESEVCDQNMLRKANFIGDFTKVRDIINGRLGNGVFEKIAAMDEVALSLRPDDLCWLTNRMAARGIDYLVWARNDGMMKHLRAQHCSPDSLTLSSSFDSLRLCYNFMDDCMPPF